MRVLLLGATGYVGGAVLDRLLERRHEVVAVLRPGRAAEPAPRPGVEVVHADAERPGDVAAAVRTTAARAVVHAAALGDRDLERRLVAELAAALGDVADAAGSSAHPEPVLLYTSGVWVLGPEQPRPHTEASGPSPIRLVAGRDRVEQAVLQSPRVRGVVLRPGIVHGRSGGIPEMMVGWARADGVGRYVEPPDGSAAFWPMVHVEDLADLVVRAVERPDVRGVLHGVAEPAVPVWDLAAAAAVAAGVAGGAQPWPFRQAAAALGADFAEALALSQWVDAPVALASGWTPRQLGAVEELRSRSVPERPGPAPVVVGPRPHAQVSQTAPPDLQHELVRQVLDWEGVEQASSSVSVPGARAFVLRPEYAGGPASAFQADTEFAHLHPRHDGSLHVALPADLAARLYAAGWGEPHPVSGTPLLYGPRDEEELAVVLAAVRASYAQARGWTAAPPADATRRATA